MKKIKVSGTIMEVNPGSDVWIGIDIHKVTMAVTVVGRHTVLDKFAGPVGESHFAALSRRFAGCQIHAVYEAGPTGYKVLNWLVALGWDAMICVPSLIPHAPGAEVKTDPRDSEKLAKLLRAELLTSIVKRDDQEYAARELLRTREQIQQARTNFMRQIRSKLLMHGIEVPEEYEGGWSKEFVTWLEEGPTGNAHIDICVRLLVGQYKGLTADLDAIGKEIVKCSQSEPYKEPAARLRTLPGVGPLTAMTLLLEAGAHTQFSSGEALANYVGLVPSEHSSGGTRQQGRILRACNGHIRSIWIEAAWQAVRKEPRFTELYERLHPRRGKARAIVAVAHQMILTAYAMLRDKTSWNPTHGLKKVA